MYLRFRPTYAKLRPRGPYALLGLPTPWPSHLPAATAIFLVLGRAAGESGICGLQMCRAVLGHRMARQAGAAGGVKSWSHETIFQIQRSRPEMIAG
jgi:hypothetical protein